MNTNTKQQTKDVTQMSNAKSPKLISPETIAAELNIDTKAVRRHLRTIVDLHNAKHADNEDAQIAKPGRGGSWAVSADMIDVIRKRLESRQSGRAVTLTADMIS